MRWRRCHGDAQGRGHPRKPGCGEAVPTHACLLSQPPWGEANVCLRGRWRALEPQHKSRNSPAGPETGSHLLLLRVRKGPLPGGLWRKSWALASQPLITDTLPARAVVLSRHRGRGAAQASRTRSKGSVLFQDTKAFENQGPHAAEAGAPGARLLRLRQRGQF